jgi:hypothetical protein
MLASSSSSSCHAAAMSNSLLSRACSTIPSLMFALRLMSSINCARSSGVMATILTVEHTQPALAIKTRPAGEPRTGSRAARPLVGAAWNDPLG